MIMYLFEKFRVFTSIYRTQKEKREGNKKRKWIFSGQIQHMKKISIKQLLFLVAKSEYVITFFSLKEIAR